MNPEILVAGSLGALFVFVLGVLKDWVLRRREREGLMTLIWVELLQNYLVLRRWDTVRQFVNARELENFRTEIWAETRVRLAQILPPHEFSTVSSYYSTIQEVRAEEAANLLVERTDDAGFEVRRDDLEYHQDRLWVLASKYSKARHGKVRRWLRI